MAATKCTNIELQNPSYATLQVLKRQQSLYDSPQQQQHIYESPQGPNKKPAVSSLVPEVEVVSSNIQHVTNSVGNYSIQKERVKRSIFLILLIASTLLNVVTVITLFTTRSCSCNSSSSCDNTTDEKLLQQVSQLNNNIDLLKTHTESIQTSQQLSGQNISALLDMADNNSLLLDGTKKDVTSSLQKLNNIINTQSIIEDIGVENKGTINNILVKVDDVLETLNSSLVSSCQDLKNKEPNSPSGYYHINSQIAFCEMGELCSTEGGWTRLAYLDMTDTTVDCPPGFMLDETAGIRSCGRPDGGGGCQSIKFPSNGISYSEVCGRVVGYQYGSTNAVDTFFNTPEDHNDINSNYVDGVSITQGFPRKHVWTLMGGYLENFPATYNCPCNTPPGDTQDVQSFIGNDYFCESGNPNSDWTPVLYSDDPLWDGEGCGTQEGDCCAAAGLPWFHKTFNYTTTNYLEIRVCGDQSISNEDIPFSFYELYVK